MVKFSILILPLVFLLGCKKEPPPCNDPSTTETVIDLLAQQVDESSLASNNAKSIDFLSISLDEQLPIGYDKEIRKRLCKATARYHISDEGFSLLRSEYVTYLKKEKPILNTFGKRQLDFLRIFGALDTKRIAVFSKLERQMNDQWPENPYEVQIAYDIQMSEGRSDILHYSAGATDDFNKDYLNAIAWSIDRQRARDESKAITKDPDQNSTSDKIEISIAKAEACSEEAFCIENPSGDTYIGQTLALSDEEINLLKSRKSVCLTGVSKDGEYFGFDHVLKSCR